MQDTVSSLSVIEIDAMAQPCPMPLLMLKRQLKKTSGSQAFKLLSSDPHSEIDVTRYCQINQLACKLIKISDHEFHYLIES